MGQTDQQNAPPDVAGAAAALTSPPFTWKSLLTIKFMNFGIPIVTRKNGTVNRTLISLLSCPFKVRPNPTAVNGVSTRDVTVDPARKLWFRLFTPTPVEESSGSTQLPVIVYFHGGGFSLLSPDISQYDAVCRRLAREIGAVVVSVNYRLAPEHRYPAQFEDGFDVLKFLDDDVTSKGLLLPENADLTRCFLAGDSAGGNLAHHVAVRACNNSDNELKYVRVIGLVALQPFFGGEERTVSELALQKVDQIVPLDRTDTYWRAFLPPEGSNRDHEAVNVSGPRAVDISKLSFPVTLVVVGGFDSIQDWQKRYHKWLKDSGKEDVELLEYPTMVHTFFLFPELKESDDLIGKLKHFVSSQCSKLRNT